MPGELHQKVLSGRMVEAEAWHSGGVVRANVNRGIPRGDIIDKRKRLC